MRRIVSLPETPLQVGRISTSLLPMPHHHASEDASYELALIGVAAHAVADILCR
ncbi:Ms4533A family Cys-rich leader peptide [Streptomyces morookaense]|uniref:Ms4533A family Cys-rich leader peptide n=1 Tax=Streptomyces morookaense TaxID=1970 RepID=UPI0034D42E8E